MITELLKFCLLSWIVFYWLRQSFVPSQHEIMIKGWVLQMSKMPLKWKREKGLGCISKMNTYHSSQKNELTLYSFDDLWNNLQLNEQAISSSYKDTNLIFRVFFNFPFSTYQYCSFVKTVNRNRIEKQL